MPNLKGMNVQALMSLRDQVDRRLLELRAELEKQLAAPLQAAYAAQLSAARPSVTARFGT